MINVALDLARQGFRVFPLLVNGKKPWRKGWQAWATSDPMDLVDRWPPGEHNVGIVTGYGFIVVDVDVKNDGIAAFEELKVQHGFAESSYVVRTPSGGLHHYYRVPPATFIGNSTKLGGKGIDIRGVGGLVAGPGSRINGRPYERIR